MNQGPMLYQMEGLVVYVIVKSSTHRRIAGNGRELPTLRTDPD